MDIKIPSGQKEGQAIEAVEEARDAIETTEETVAAQQASPAALDAVTKIAEQVALGEIGRKEAIDMLIADVLDANIVKTAPNEVGRELAEILEALLETDPHLKSLSSVLGPENND